MSQRLPEYKEPPVVETVMSVQFAPLPKYSTLLAGWYWKKCLGNDWTKAEEAAPLPDQFERFGDEARWERPGIRLALAQQGEPGRVQIEHRDEERMIQLQRTRFIFNWRKRGTVYPRYRTLRPEFDTLLARFTEFAREAELGEPRRNQWEVTYVNHIPKGPLWRTPAEWQNVLPGFSVPSPGGAEEGIESCAGAWHRVIQPNRGRLHVTANHGKTASAEGPQEVLILQLTARGPIDENKGWDLNGGLELGRDSIVLSFDAMTSDAAHKHWGRGL